MASLENQFEIVIIQLLLLFYWERIIFQQQPSHLTALMDRSLVLAIMQKPLVTTTSMVCNTVVEVIPNPYWQVSESVRCTQLLVKQLARMYVEAYSLGSRIDELMNGKTRSALLQWIMTYTMHHFRGWRPWTLQCTASLPVTTVPPFSHNSVGRYGCSRSIDNDTNKKACGRNTSETGGTEVNPAEWSLCSSNRLR